MVPGSSRASCGFPTELTRCESDSLEENVAFHYQQMLQKLLISKFDSAHDSCNGPSRERFVIYSSITKGKSRLLFTTTDIS